MNHFKHSLTLAAATVGYLEVKHDTWGFDEIFSAADAA
jgi:hypothetical protein